MLTFYHLAGEFATQTCFQGRFGEETGSDQFGGMILAHPGRPSRNDAILRVSNLELTYVGQAFRLGRYAIHHHIQGKLYHILVYILFMHTPQYMFQNIKIWVSRRLSGQSTRQNNCLR